MRKLKPLSVEECRQARHFARPGLIRFGTELITLCMAEPCRQCGQEIPLGEQAIAIWKWGHWIYIHAADCTESVSRLPAAKDDLDGQKGQT